MYCTRNAGLALKYVYAGNGHDNGTVKQWYAEKFDSFMAVKIRIFSLKYLEACLL